MKNIVTQLVNVKIANATVANPPRLVRANSAFEKNGGGK